MTRLTHFSLFSGIGGLDLAAEWAGFETVGQCEISDYPTRVLEEHWPDVPRWRDIYELRADEFFERTGLQPSDGGCSGLTVLSGGFPCQPHSFAGSRKASCDERDLWPEYRRVIRELRPKWVVAENVRGLLSSDDGRFFGNILRDLAELGFDVGWCLYGAAHVGAIHRRDRVFIVAHANCERIEERYWCEFSKSGQQMDAPFKDNRTTICSETMLYILDAFQASETAPAYLRTDYGLSDWAHRIKAIGNAVCPQQAFPIFKAIAEVENND
jgi:DNA (cytosine-5)-methyltransferase 1